MKTLHVLRNPDDKKAWDIAANDEGSSVLLIHDGVYAEIENAYKCKDDLGARDLPGDGLAYNDIVKLIVEHDKVIVW